MHMNLSDVNEDFIIKHIRKQFLCNVPINEFNFHKTNSLSYNAQKALLDCTINSELNKTYPIRIEYQKAFLKKLLHDVLEKQESDVHDDVYVTYARLVSPLAQNNSNNFVYKHYEFLSHETITLKENINIICEGTTGLRTWQASLVLCDWILHHQESFESRNILELGCGVGLTGLTVIKQCSPSKFYFTDCHTSVLKTLCDNISINLNEFKRDIDNTDIFAKYTSDKTVIQVLNLPWECIDTNVCNNYRLDQVIDKIIAADIIYDRELFPALISAIKCLSVCCNIKEIIFSCTERNRDTLDEFLELMRGEHFEIEELEVPTTQEYFIWSTATPVKMYAFHLGN